MSIDGWTGLKRHQAGIPESEFNIEEDERCQTRTTRTDDDVGYVQAKPLEPKALAWWQS